MKSVSSKVHYIIYAILYSCFSVLCLNSNAMAQGSQFNHLFEEECVERTFNHDMKQAARFSIEDHFGLNPEYYAIQSYQRAGKFDIEKGYRTRRIYSPFLCKQHLRVHYSEDRSEVYVKEYSKYKKYYGSCKYTIKVCKRRHVPNECEVISREHDMTENINYNLESFGFDSNSELNYIITKVGLRGTWESVSDKLRNKWYTKLGDPRFNYSHHAKNLDCRQLPVVEILSNQTQIRALRHSKDSEERGFIVEQLELHKKGRFCPIKPSFHSGFCTVDVEICRQP